MAFTIPFGTMGKSILVDEPLEVDKPLVLLVHGMGGSSADWVNPVGAYPGLAFNTSFAPPPLRQEGVHPIPPLVPVSGFFTDPALTSAQVTSWRTALLAAGFAVANYSQVGGAMGGLTSGGVVTEFASAIAALSTDVRTRDLKIVVLAHSRGGLVSRIFLASATPAARASIVGLITLHSPHTGSGIAGIASSVNTAAASVQGALATLGVTPPAILTTLRGFVGSPNILELAPGPANPLWAFLAAREPVPGVTYHTFGGNSTIGMRIWGRVYTPLSYVPMPVPWPMFIWSSSPAVMGAPLDPVSFAPLAPALLLVPGLAALVPAITALPALAPDLTNGLGDVLVANARAHLPFSATTTTNFLNHLQALYNPSLQAQVTGLLRTFTPSRGTGRGGYDLASTEDRIIPYDFSSVGRLNHLVAYRPGQGTIWVLRSSGVTPSSFTPVFAEGAPGMGVGGYDLASPADRVIPYDYNSTGRLDHLVLYRPGTGAIFILRRAERPRRFFQAVYSQGDPGAGIGTYDLLSPNDRIIPFDFNHNGRLDHLVMYRPGGGAIHILRNAGGTFQAAFASGAGIGGFNLASPADRVIPFDFNANGRPDHLLLYRPGARTVRILANNNGVFSTVFNSTGGIGGYDLASAADRILPFDGAKTGRLDHLLLYRPGTGTIWVLRRSGGTFNAIFAEGAPGKGIGGYELDDPGDRLMPFDYDGTGFVDHLLAYRPGSGIARVIAWNPTSRTFATV